MIAKLFAASAAALALAASVAHAAPEPAVQAFLDETYSQAQAQAQAQGFDLSARPVKVRAYVDGDGRLTAVHVVESAGSRDTDYQVEAALRRVRLHYVPPALIGAKVNLAFGAPDARLAKAP